MRRGYGKSGLRRRLMWTATPHAGMSPSCACSTSKVRNRSRAVMSDKWIRAQALESGMIEPFVDRQTRDGCISYGLSSYGYAARVSVDFKIFTNVDNARVDPNAVAHNSFVDRQGPVCIIPPNSFILARAVEYFPVPRDDETICP